MLQEYIEIVRQKSDLTPDQMQQAITWMLAGRIENEQVRELLLALRDKGESVNELVGAARAMRVMMTPIRSQRTNLVDTCGTGGDGTRTFNISTAAALVAAAAGAPIAKHGNRKITSSTGSADVLSELGVDVEASREVVERSLESLGICFCYAPKLHPAMKHVGEVRRSIAVPTLFNYLGPLANPASAPYQIIGVGKEALQTKIAAALLQLPIKAAAVVRGEDGMDEVTLAADTQVHIIQHNMLTQTIWTPKSFGLPVGNVDDLIVDGPVGSAQAIREILAGAKGPRRDIVLANAAAALWISEQTHSLLDGVAKAAHAIDSGKAAALLQQLGNETRAAVE